MDDPRRLRMGFIGSGVMARVHMESMVRDDLAEIVAVSEPSSAAYASTVVLFQQAGAKPPVNEPDWRRFIDRLRRTARRGVHRDPPRLPFRAGERVPRSRAGCPPREADGHERRRSERADLGAEPDRPDAGRLVPGQPFATGPDRVKASALRAARRDPRYRRRRLAGLAAEHRWHVAAGPALSGGGFLFDTGAHMLNTVSDLAGEGFSEVAAWLENDGSAGRHPGSDHGAARLGRARHDAWLWKRDPFVRLRHPRVL